MPGLCADPVNHWVFQELPETHRDRDTLSSQRILHSSCRPRDLSPHTKEPTMHKGELGQEETPLQQSKRTPHGCPQAEL